MKQNFTTQKIVLQREEEISIKQKALERYLEHAKDLQENIQQKKEFLNSYKKTLENTLK